MKLSLACRQLHRAILHNASLRSRTYWYRPGSLDVAALRGMDRKGIQATLARAREQGDVGLLTDETYSLPDNQRLSLRPWFRTIGEFIAASLHRQR